MGMTRGHIYVAFGKEYDMQAAHSALAARRFSSLPILVLTNRSEKERSDIWAKVTKVSFRRFKLPDKENRDIKTKAVYYTPFDQTLFTDTDTVIQSSQFLKSFELLNSCDIAFSIDRIFQIGGKVLRLYREAMNMFSINLPLVVYQGGVFVFKKNAPVEQLFSLWNTYWDKFGRGREMMCLACAAKNIEGVAIGTLSKDYGHLRSHIIQHFVGGNAVKTPLLPCIKKSKQFDKKYGPGRWDWVD